MHTSLYIISFIKNKLCSFEKNTFLENFEMEKNFDQRGFFKIAVRNEKGTREIHQDLIVACGELAFYLDLLFRFYLDFYLDRTGNEKKIK